MPNPPRPLDADSAASARHVLDAALRGEPGLTRAVKSWQRRLGVDDDGIIGPRTKAAYDAALPPDLAHLRYGAAKPEPEHSEPGGLAVNGWPLGGATHYRLSEHGPGHRLSEHFTLVEFASKDGADEVLVHPALVALLEAIRAKLGRPVTINSGYRTPAHNARVGGASESRHKYGMAADIAVRGLPASALYAVAEDMEPGGLGRYHSWVHVDVQGHNRRWDGP